MNISMNVSSGAIFYEEKEIVRGVLIARERRSIKESVGLVLPDLAGKLDGFAIRVPMVNVSVVDFTFEALRDTTVHEINQLMRAASQTSLKNILAYVDEPLVSIDFNHHPASSIFDASGTKVLGRLVKVLSWYDNEWGFSNRMLDTTLAWMHAK